MEQVDYQDEYSDVEEPFVKQRVELVIEKSETQKQID